MIIAIVIATVIIRAIVIAAVIVRAIVIAVVTVIAIIPVITPAVIAIKMGVYEYFFKTIDVNVQRFPGPYIHGTAVNLLWPSPEHTVVIYFVYFNAVTT
jgi:hypothetical protein